ncbi:MAG: hypothetical protein HYY06_23730 [Deltaproteobacteria bacterium]|nr:hypothetical protein [Deltaproteobacteria bacterium]
MDLSAYSTDRPAVSLRLLFIHHSCGGQLLAPVGGNVGDCCIYRSHPNGGGLRPHLEQNGYEVHEASYGSRIGHDTDLFDWLPKFRDTMDDVLTCSHQNDRYPDSGRNQIVVFKSCFPNSSFVGDGAPPGKPLGPELTGWNARATMTAVLAELAKKPGVLFVYVTAPPIAPTVPRRPAWKVLARTLLGSSKTDRANLLAGAAIARRFNDWVRSPDGWLHGYPHSNVVVFDYFDVLTDSSASSLLRYPTGEDGSDSHPSAEGNALAARALVPLMNQAVRRAGLSR